jgi:hypothetical protein
MIAMKTMLALCFGTLSMGAIAQTVTTTGGTTNTFAVFGGSDTHDATNTTLANGQLVQQASTLPGQTVANRAALVTPLRILLSNPGNIITLNGIPGQIQNFDIRNDQVNALVFQSEDSSAVPFAIDPLGNIGVGTITPAFNLDVVGKIHASSAIVFPDGTSQMTAFIPANCGADYAESVDVTGDRTNYEPGDILVIDPNANIFVYGKYDCAASVSYGYHYFRWSDFDHRGREQHGKLLPFLSRTVFLPSHGRYDEPGV